jgi:hypothetical protein
MSPRETGMARWWGRGAEQGAMPCPAAVSYGTIVFINDWISDGESARL